MHTLLHKRQLISLTSLFLLQFAPGTYLVPRSTVPAHVDVTSMQYSMQGMEAEQMPHGQQPYLSNDSLLLQHYADMELGQAGGLRGLLQAEPNVTPTVNFDMDRAIVGMLLEGLSQWQQSLANMNSVLTRSLAI